MKGRSVQTRARRAADSRVAAARPLVQTDPTAALLVALLRAQLGTGPEPSATQFAHCDWRRFERLASHHAVTPILYQALRGRADLIPARRLQRLRLAYHGHALRNRAVDRFAGEVAGALSTARIEVIVLKGAALLRTLYPDPALRPLGDIDLLIDEQDLGRADEQLRALGLESNGYGHQKARGPLCHFHACYSLPTSTSIPVELHWRLFEAYHPYVFDLAEVRARARPLPGMPEGVLTMSPEHELAYLCLHLERHAVIFRSLLDRADWFEVLLMPQGLARLVWLYDIALYLQRPTPVLDWNALIAMARRAAIDAHLHAVFELCRRTLGVGAPATALAALDRGAPRLADRLAHRALLASRRSPDGRSSEPARSGADWATAIAPWLLLLSRAWSTVFPCPRYLRAAYPDRRSAARRYEQHLRIVAPQLWSEIRERFVG